MTETAPAQPDSRESTSEAGMTATEIRERADTLQRKIGDLSKTLDHIERSLAEAGGESEEGRSGGVD
jgi:hypothetical protein